MNNQDDITDFNQKLSTTKQLTNNKPLIENRDKDTFETVLFSRSTVEQKAEGGLRTKGYFKHNFPNQPLVTIITVVFNGQQYLEEAILSVLSQTYDNIEYIIVDGESTDKTLDIIRKYDNVIDYWLSEPDQGIYDAMNKGISLSQGNLIGILNSDDLYYKYTVSEIVNFSSKFHHQPCVIYGDMIKLSPENKNSYSYHQGNMNDNAFKTFQLTINHPTCFIHKEVYKKYGLFDLQYLNGADRELLIRFNQKDVPFLYLERPIAQFRLGGTTSKFSLKDSLKLIRNRYTLLKNYYLNSNEINIYKHLFHYSIRVVIIKSLMNLVEKVIGEDRLSHLRIINLVFKSRKNSF